MKDCTHPDGHLWTNEFPRAEGAPFDFVPGGGQYPIARFHGVTSQFVRCVRSGCGETGYRIQEVAQSVSQDEEAVHA